MAKREAEEYQRMMTALAYLGFSSDEREQLRRISMTLHHWYELECGDGNNYCSWAIERDENGEGPPFMAHHHYMHGNGKDTVSRWRIPDRETGARKRLSAIMAKHAPLSAYVQTDPRGAALYILRPGDVPEGKSADGYYSRGICVY